MQQLTEANQAPVVRLESKGTVPATYSDAGYGGSYGNRLDSGGQPDGGGLLEYWRILNRRKGTLILITSIGAVMGFLATLPQTPIYQAHTSLEIVGLNQNFLNMKEANPLDEGGASSNTVDIQTQVKILQSDSLKDQVLGKLKVPATTGVESGRVSVWRKALNLPDAEPVDARQQAIAYAKKNYKVRASGQTRIIDVTVDSLSPQVAAEFANVLANEFIDQSLEARWKTTERTGQFLTRQIDDMRVRLEQSEDKLQQYARMAGLLFTEDKNNVSEQRLTQVQMALSAAQAERISKQSRWEMANSSSPEALPDILNDLTLRDYQTKLTELHRQVAEQRSTYTAENTKVKRIEAQIAPVQAAQDRERGDILKRIRNEYDEALRKEKLLAADYAAQRGVVTGEGEKAIQYNILKREVDSNRQLYDAMLQQLKQASLASALRASNIRVVDPAEPPKRPYKPDVLLGSGLGLMSGIFFGAAFLVMRERSDRSIQEPGETGMYLDLPELGVIPSDTLGPRLRVRMVTGKNAAAPKESPLQLQAQELPEELPQRVELVTWQRKPSMVAESFRAALVSILFSGENGNRPRTLVVTSCSPSEGKSTVASNLGIAVAEVNQKVLLIDADMRKPRLHDIFNLKNDHGLSDLLQSQESPAVLPQGIIQETNVANLYVLPSGKSTPAATSLLYSSRMPELLKALRNEFETIIVDTPPMLQIPDARVVGRMVDRVIIVVRAGKTTRDAVMAANQKFAEDGTRVLGTILNDWNPKNSPGGYYGYYNGYYNSYYKHGYGAESKKA
jgi:succinoglycan biosynthesis transport protein ExoP